MDFIKNLFISVGLTSPMSRFIFFTVSTAIALIWIKPSFAFNSKKEMRPWKLFYPNDKDSTYLTFWLLAILIGIIADILF